MKSQKYPQQTIIERKFQEQIFDKICEDLKVFAPFTTPQCIETRIGYTNEEREIINKAYFNNDIGALESLCTNDSIMEYNPFSDNITFSPKEFLNFLRAESNKEYIQNPKTQNMIVHELTHYYNLQSYKDTRQMWHNYEKYKQEYLKYEKILEDIDKSFINKFLDIFLDKRVKFLKKQLDILAEKSRLGKLVIENNKKYDQLNIKTIDEASAWATGNIYYKLTPNYKSYHNKEGIDPTTLEEYIDKSTDFLNRHGGKNGIDILRFISRASIDEAAETGANAIKIYEDKMRGL